MYTNTVTDTYDQVFIITITRLDIKLYGRLLLDQKRSKFI